MNNKIGELIKEHIEKLSLTELTAGIVETISKGPTEGNKRGYKYPAYYDVDKEEYIDCTPDSVYKSISFIEDYGIEIVGKHRYTTTLRVNFWNNKDAGVVYIAYMLAEFINSFPASMQRYGELINVVTEFREIVTKNTSSLFSRYSFEESTRQYLMYPFEAAGITIRVTFSYNPICQ